MKLDVLTLPFDQYQRYRLVSDLVNEVRGKGERFTVLDVGGRTGLLRAFLPADDVALVDLEPSDVPGLVIGDGSRLPYKDKAFDIVATFDTLEHVPPPRRKAFVSECARVAKRWVFIAGPYQTQEVEEAERILQRFLVDKLEVEHRYLEEHRHNGLPSLRDTEGGLAAGGARVASIGHGNLERWLALMSLSMYLDYEPRLRPLATRVFRFYNENLYASDHARPVYRHAVVGALDGAKLPQGTTGLEAPIAPQGVLDRFRTVADEVVSFDRARNDWREERARLAEILATLERDLAGHRAALLEVNKLKSEQEAVLRTLEVDLEGHRASLTQASNLLDRERDQSSNLRGELEAHRAEAAHLLDTLREEQKKASDSITTLATDLEAHRALRTELENRIAERDLVLSELESDLEHHRRALEATKAIVDEQRAAISELRDAIGDRQAAVEALTVHRRSLEESLSDRENQIAILTDVRGALERDLKAHREALRDLETDLAGHKKVLAERESDLDQHRRTVKALENELARHRREHETEIASWQARVAEHKAVEADLSRDLGEHKKVLAEVTADLAAHRRLAADLRAELEVRHRDLARLTEELTRAIRSNETASQQLQEQDQLIRVLRGDLKHRWKSVKRAFGPKRPTPGEPT